MVNDLLDMKDCVDLTLDSAQIFYDAYKKYAAGDFMSATLEVVEGIS